MSELGIVLAVLFVGFYIAWNPSPYGTTEDRIGGVIALLLFFGALGCGIIGAIA